MIISRTRLTGMSSASVGRFAVKVRRSVGVRGLVNVLLTTSTEMKALNCRFRGKDVATDVLSFQAQGDDGLAGEIAISLDIAKQNALRLGHTTSDEIKVLILHGMLHLAGYDHENDHGEMLRKEQRLRRVLKLPAGLIDRSQPKTAFRNKASLLAARSKQ